MKKFLFVVFAIMTSLNSSAQFTVYQNVHVPSRSSTQSNYNPYRSYETNPYGNYSRSTQPKEKQYNLTGYYKNIDGWHKTPIKVSIRGEEIKLVSVKVGKKWAPCNSRVNEVSEFDPEEIKENFNYKGYLSFLGSVYF